jgi:CRISP-associated protein Cas1
MLSTNNLKHKQILIINASEDSFNLEIDNILIKDKIGNKTSKINLHNVFAIYLINGNSITTNLIKRCKELGVSLIFCNSNFKVYSSIKPVAEANYLLRQRQYTICQSEEIMFAKTLLGNKFHNQNTLLKSVQLSTEDIINYHQKLESIQSYQDLLGVEGFIAKGFFEAYFEKMNWRRRAPRTKEDINNLLLDIGYTYIFNYIDSLLLLFGFDTYKGIYHKLFFGRKSLSCDVVEPFRCIVDKALLKAHNLKQIKLTDFELDKNDSYYLPFKNSKKYNQIFMQAIMDQKLEIFETVQSFYRHLMNPTKNAYKPFKI